MDILVFVLLFLYSFCYFYIRFVKLSIRFVKLSIRFVKLSIRFVKLSIRLVKLSIRFVKLSIRLVNLSIRFVKLSIRTRQPKSFAHVEACKCNTGIECRNIHQTFCQSWVRTQSKAPVVSLENTLYTHCLASVGSRYGFDCNFTIEFK